MLFGIYSTTSAHIFMHFQSASITLCCKCLSQCNDKMHPFSVVCGQLYACLMIGKQRQMVVLGQMESWITHLFNTNVLLTVSKTHFKLHLALSDRKSPYVQTIRQNRRVWQEGNIIHTDRYLPLNKEFELLFVGWRHRLSTSRWNKSEH